MTKPTRDGEDGGRGGDSRDAARREADCEGPRDAARILAAFDAPDAPASLRERALRAACDALERPPRRDAWRRICENRVLRAAWCAAAAALVVANVLALSRKGSAPRPLPASGDPSVEPELRAELTLPRIDKAFLEGGGAAERAPADSPSSVVPRKEKNS